MSALAVADALRRVGPAKVVARLAGVSPKTAARWQRGESTPDVITAFAMMSRCPVLRAALLRAFGFSDLLDEIEAVELLDRAAQLRARTLARRDRHAAIEAMDRTEAPQDLGSPG